MKRAAFKLHPERGGWLRTTIAPINDKDQPIFGVVDVVMLVSLVLMVVALARLLLAR